MGEFRVAVLRVVDAESEALIENGNVRRAERRRRAYRLAAMK